MVILEGLVQGGMAKLLARLGRDFANSTTVKYMANPDVQFTSRVYTRWVYGGRGSGRCVD
jgi:hypothetical protein